MATAMDPFEGAKAEREDQRKQLLDVVSQGGAAAKKAYDDAQAAVTQSRQEAINRAAQRAQITGTNYGGQDLNPVADAAGLQGGYLAGQSAAAQSHMGSIGASGESYLAKVGAIAPFIQSQNLEKAAQRENEYKTAIAQAQAKIDAEKAAQAAEFARQKELLAYKDSLEQKSSAAKAKAEAANKITLPQLIGYANQEPGYMRDNQNILGQAKGGENIAAANLLQRAGQYGRQLGVDPNKLAELSTPNLMQQVGGDLRGIAGKPGPVQIPPTFDKNWLTSSFRLDGKPISSKRADEVLQAPEVRQADLFLGELVNTKVRNGRIDDASAGEFQGMSPKDAFISWLDAQPGIRTMKQALKDYYLPWIESNVRG